MEAGEERADCRSLQVTATSCTLMQVTCWKGPFRAGFKGNQATRFGQGHEQQARQLYPTEMGVNVQICGIVVPPLAPWLASVLA